MQCCALVQGWDKFTSSASLEKQWKASALSREQSPVGGATRGTVPGRAWGLGFTDPRELWAQVAAAATMLLQSCPTLCNPRRQPTRLRRPWDSPGKNTGVGCHFLLQCMKAKSESEVTQLCPTLRDPMDCSPPGSSVHGIFQARVLEWGAVAFSGGRRLAPG